jgi:PAS domain S-box-containing protein
MVKSRKSRMSDDVRRPRRKGERSRPTEAQRLPEIKEPADQAAEELMRLARIPEENPDPVFRVSAEHVLVYSNPAGEGLCVAWGCRIGQRVPAAVGAVISAALADGAVARRKVAFDSHIYALTVAPSVADGYVNIYARDITDYERAKESLRQAEQRFRTIFDSTSDGVFLLELETRKFTMCNQSCLQMLGYTEEEFMKLSVADLHPEADLPFIYAQIDEFVKGREGTRHDIRFKRKDGNIVFADLSPNLIVLDGRRYILVALKDITERKRAEKALVASERKYRSLVQNIPDVTWTTDQEGRTLFISSNVLNVYGYSAEEIYGGADTWLRNVHPDDRPRIESAFNALFTGEAPYDVEYRIRRKDGTWIWLHDRSVSSYERDGQWYADGIFSDITEHKRMEEELRRHTEHLEELVAARARELQESEAGLAAAQRLAHLGSWQWNIGEDTATWSEETFRIFGIAREPLRRHREEFLSRIVPEDRPRVDQALADALSGARDYDLDYRITLPDGRERVIHAQAQVLRSRDGQPVTMYGTVQDITERKQTEEALRESEQRLKRAQEIAHLGSWELNLTNDHLSWSDEVYRIFGLQPQEFGASYEAFLDCVHPEDRDAVDAAYSGSLREGRDTYEIEHRVVRRSTGEIRIVHEKCEHIRDASGRIIRSVGMVHDITERKRAEEALRQLSRRNEEALRVARMGHWEFDLATGIFTFNDQYYTLHGTTAREAGGYQMTAEEFARKYVHPDDAHLVQEHIQQAAAAIDPDFQLQAEARILCTDGEVRWVTVWFRIEKDAQGETATLYGVNQDITEQKRAEEALRKSEEKFAKAFRSSPVAIAVTRLSDGRIIEVNEALLKLLHFSRDEVIGRTTLELGIWVDVNDRAEYTRRLLRDGSTRGLEYRLRTKDGDIVTIHLSAELLELSGEACMLATLVDLTERKRAEEALAESRKRYRGLVEKINDWVWEIDADGVYTYASPRALELLGYTPEEIVGKTPFDFMPPGEAQRVRNAFQPIWLQRKPLELLENALVRKDGRLVTVETSGMPMFAEDGSFLGYTGIDRDVTSRKRAEEALRESEQRYRRLVENLKGSHFVYRHDTTGMLTYVSESVTQVLGYTLDEGMSHYGKYFTDHPANQAAHRHTELTLQGIPQPPYEVNMWHKDGSTRWLEVQEVSVYDADGKVVAVEGVAQDITERKQAQEALLESEERYRILLEHGFDGIFVHEDFRIVQLNDRLTEMTGYTRAELMGSKAIDLFTTESQERIRRYIASAATEYFEIELRRRDGRIVDVESYGAPCRFQGRNARIVGLRDVTERKQVQEAMRTLNEQLEVQVAQRTEELRRTVDRLRQLTLELSQAEDRERKRIADILHEDVQQMLAAARFHLNLLCSGACSAEESQRIVQQVRQLLRDAIERSRNLSHELSPAIYQVELTEILEWLARHMQQKHGLTVRVEAHGRVDSPSESLKAFLYKVAQELLFNVVKHAGVHEARVRVRRMGRSIYLSVVDRGRGFDPEELEGAAGFGLLSIRERVRLLGGQMKIRSMPGMGSRILIAVPDQGASGVAVPAEYGRGQAQPETPAQDKCAEES